MWFNQAGDLQIFSLIHSAFGFLDNVLWDIKVILFWRSLISFLSVSPVFLVDFVESEFINHYSHYDLSAAFEEKLSFDILCVDTCLFQHRLLNWRSSINGFLKFSHLLVTITGLALMTSSLFKRGVQSKWIWDSFPWRSGTIFPFQCTWKMLSEKIN